LNGILQTTANRFAGIVRKRPGVAVCLSGEAGLGKSYTALEVLRLTPCRHLVVRANVSITELLRLLPKPDRLSSWVQRSLEQHSLERSTAEVSHEVLAAVLTGLAPFVLMIEDLHEASPEVLEFWQGLATVVARSKGVGLLATTRGDTPAGFDALPLEAKTLEETTALVQAELKGTPPAEAMAWIQARAAGNPLYVLEHTRFLARRGFLWSDGRRWRWRIPPNDLLPVTLEAMIEQELRTLTHDPDVRAVLEAFTVLEARGLVRQPLLMRVALVNEIKCAQALAMLEGARLIDGLEFRHPLYREVMAQSLAAARRQELEGRAFDALSQGDPLAASRFLEHARVTDVQALEVLQRAEVLARANQDAVLTARMQALATRYATGERRAQSRPRWGCVASVCARPCHWPNSPCANAQMILNPCMCWPNCSPPRDGCAKLNRCSSVCPGRCVRVPPGRNACSTCGPGCATFRACSSCGRLTRHFRCRPIQRSSVTSVGHFCMRMTRTAHMT
jgi:hypothetical protein